MAQIALPFPPSLNGLFKNRRKGRAKTPRYEDWIIDAGWELLQQHPLKHTDPVTIHILVCPPSKRLFDLDNYAKAPLDLLVKHKIIPDDNIQIVKKLTIELGAGEPRILLTILEF